MADYAIGGVAAGSSMASAAVTVTVPAGSNHAALVVLQSADLTYSGITASQGTITLVDDTFTFFSTPIRTFQIVGLSPGSLTVTPSGGTGGSAIMTVIVASDVNQSTPLAALVTGIVDPAETATTRTVTTTDAGALAVHVTGNGGGALGSLAATSPATLRTSGGPNGYGGYQYAATRERDAATTDVAFTHALAQTYSIATAFLPAAGGGGGGEVLIGNTTVLFAPVG